MAANTQARKKEYHHCGYSDSDMAGDVGNRKSTSGIAYILEFDLLDVTEAKGSCTLIL